MKKRKGLRAGISSIRQDYRSGGLVSKEGPRQNFFYGGVSEGFINFDPLQNLQNLPGIGLTYTPPVNIGFGYTPPDPKNVPGTPEYNEAQSKIKGTPQYREAQQMAKSEDVNKTRQKLQEEAAGQGTNVC